MKEMDFKIFKRPLVLVVLMAMGTSGAALAQSPQTDTQAPPIKHHYKASKVAPLKNFLNTTPDLRNQGPEDAIFDEVGTRDGHWVNDGVTISLGHIKFKRQVYDNGDGTYSVVDSYATNLGDQEVVKLPALVGGSSGQEIQVIHQAHSLNEISSKGRDSSSIQEKSGPILSWIDSIVTVPKNWKPVHDSESDVAGNKKEEARENQFIQSIRNSKIESQWGLGKGAQKVEDPFKLPATNPLSPAKLLSDLYQPGDIISYVTHGDYGIGAGTPGYYGTGAQIAAYSKHFWRVTIMKENEGKVKVRVETIPDRNGVAVNAGVNFDPSTLSPYPLTPSIPLDGPGFPHFRYTRDKNTDHIYEHVYEYDLNSPCGEAAYSRAVSNSGKDSLALTRKCAQLDWGVDPVLYKRTTHHARRFENSQEKKTLDWTLGAHQTAHTTDCATIAVQEQKDGDVTSHYRCDTSFERDSKRRLFFRHNRQENFESDVDAALDDNNQDQGQLLELHQTITVSETRMSKKSQGKMLDYIAKSLGKTVPVDEKLTGRTSFLLDVKFPAQTISTIVNADRDRIWKAMAKAVGFEENEQWKWETSAERQAWLNDAVSGHVTCYNTNAFLGDHSSCETLFRKAESLVNKLDDIKKATSIKSQVKALNDLARTMEPHPVWLRTLIDLAENQPVDAKLRIINNKLPGGSQDYVLVSSEQAGIFHTRSFEEQPDHSRVLIPIRGR